MNKKLEFKPVHVPEPYPKPWEQAGDQVPKAPSTPFVWYKVFLALDTTQGLPQGQRTTLVALAGALQAYATPTTGDNICPSQRTLAQTLGISVGTVKDHIHALYQAGWITKGTHPDGKHSRANAYQLTVPMEAILLAIAYEKELGLPNNVWAGGEGNKYKGEATSTPLYLLNQYEQFAHDQWPEGRLVQETAHDWQEPYPTYSDYRERLTGQDPNQTLLDARAITFDM